MRKLHIGGSISCEGWEVIDAIPGTHVDHVGDAADLSRFTDCSFDEIYASHVLEHFDFAENLFSTLQEWHRVLTPTGRIYISVPDMDVLAGLFLDKKNNSAEERFLIMRMMFGGHINKYDYHLVGLNEDFLVSYLMHAGFKKILRVVRFGIFNDTSEQLFKGTPISLNIIAHKEEAPPATA